MGNPRASYAARTVPDKADVSARSAVASNPSTPADVLRKLARDRDWRVRADAASNPSAPADALRKLAEDEDGLVRRAVASNPSAPADVLAKLAGNEEGGFRYGYVFMLLSGNKSWLVCKAARKNLENRQW